MASCLSSVRGMHEFISVSFRSYRCGYCSALRASVDNRYQWFGLIPWCGMLSAWTGWRVWWMILVSIGASGGFPMIMPTMLAWMRRVKAIWSFVPYGERFSPVSHAWRSFLSWNWLSSKGAFASMTIWRWSCQGILNSCSPCRQNLLWCQHCWFVFPHCVDVRGIQREWLTESSIWMQCIQWCARFRCFCIIFGHVEGSSEDWNVFDMVVPRKN